MFCDRAVKPHWLVTGAVQLAFVVPTSKRSRNQSREILRASGSPVISYNLSKPYNPETRRVSFQNVGHFGKSRTYSVCPLPIVPALGIDYTAVLKSHQEFARFILDVNKAVYKVLYVLCGSGAASLNVAHNLGRGEGQSNLEVMAAWK
jgi:hypothetical protein